MDISVTLYGRLRDYLPQEQRGKATFPAAEVSTVADLLHVLGIEEQVTVSINSEQEVALTKAIAGGDKILVFAPVAGG